ncbi:hypothetical protein R1sor_023765 [Riccia sorocarpa]|uniref:N-acyl-L-amino-acid amidohydrolase n=1 Tax=Riccia sorocarpa TaxID=122646 RepID=A0ABD3GUH9_9MARC
MNLRRGSWFGFLFLLCFRSQVCARGPEVLEQNPAVQRFRSYLRIPTVHPEPDYGPAIEFLQGQAKEVGLLTRVFEFVPKKPILLMTWKGSSKEKLQSVILNSHMDVVTVEEDKWKYPPFEAHMDEEGNIYARGSQDMKVVGMMYLEAIRILKAQGWAPVRDIHVLWVPDEEIAGMDGWGKFYSSKEFDELNAGIVLDEGHISYNNTYIVNNEEKAVWWLVIQATGGTGHGSVYFDNSASENMFKSLGAINAFRDAQMALVRSGQKLIEDVVVINSVYLKSGSPTPDGFTMNVQPSVVEAGFDVRIPPVKELGHFMTRLIVEEWAPEGRNMSFYFKVKTETVTGEIPSTIADDTNPWWSLMRKAVSKFNATLSPQRANGASDSRFVRMRGVSALGITPIQNVPFLIHSHNEVMNGYEFLKGIAVTTEIVKEYGSYSGSTVEQTSSENYNVGILPSR